MLIGRLCHVSIYCVFFDVNQTGHGSEVLNGLYHKFFSPLRDSLFGRYKREKTSDIQGTGA